MVDVRNKPATEIEAEDKLTELYLKLERLQGYIRRLEGRVNKYTMDLEAVRKAREERGGELIRGLSKKKPKVSDHTI